MERVIIEALKGKIFSFNEIMKITECTRAPVVGTDEYKGNIDCIVVTLNI